MGVPPAQAQGTVGRRCVWEGQASKEVLDDLGDGLRPRGDH